MTATTAAPARNSTRAIQAADARHHLHPFTDHAGLAAKGARVIARAEGRTLALYREMQRRNGRKGVEKQQAGTQAMTERLKREAAQKRSATLNEERRAVWL